MDDKWLWDHMQDFQMGLYDRFWKVIYKHNTSALNRHSEYKNPQIEDEAKYIAGELVNLIAYSMGKKIAESSGNNAILKELDQFKNSVTQNPQMTTHLTETQIKRAEKYGAIYYLFINNNSLDEIANKTGLPTEIVNASLNDDLWIMGYDSDL